MHTLTFDERARANAETLIEMALAEDLDGAADLTSTALIAPDAQGQVNIVVRDAGVVAGLPIVDRVFSRLDRQINVELLRQDGADVRPGMAIARISGPLRSLLTGERTALNFLTHLSGIATLTRQYVDAVADSNAAILDTRKTLPGWRHLQKYAVRAGGGTNHRLGLYDGVLIKDNHLAAWAERATEQTIAASIRAARASVPTEIRIEVEVDTLQQFSDALGGSPDIVLLDNMPCEMLKEAVEIRNSRSPGVQLEASGGITLETVAAIAATGVDRISVGALTHSAIALDLAFDWYA